ncbi:gliding motility-associated C-terminal domain-containing protein [Fluviicola sp.]|uniref:T9SS type B sorting domain-containing protein n=1 Tax=Fluviicola sp. TaxID=1917219 RepID=UPI00282A5A3D|nr:gliding motility-associated C-terminal domain-containing protein [Fluviicola sp.]MDR0802919.1 gliding motility-associated C-terminal domain-containing protein [Fluviicola sp.]
MLFVFPHGFAQQNLVYNGSFEEYYSCPVSNDLGNGQLELCKGWWKPTLGTSDYFNRCNTNNGVGIPVNFWGYQEAYGGDGYVGLYPIDWYIISGEYFGFEYIQTQLIRPLVSCVEYHFEMQVNFANYSRYGISRLGALFTKNPIHTSTENAITFTPQVLNNQGFLTDTAHWVTVSGNFIATGNEQYLCIGYFFDNVQNDTLNFQPPVGFLNEGGGYYYIDNVSLVEVGAVENCDYELPNIVTPNNDGVNDVWEYSSSFEGRLTIMNRWGNIIYEATGTSFHWNGADCTDGVYYYIYYSEGFSKTGFIQLIR